MRRTILIGCALFALLVVSVASAQGTATPKALVDTYGSLADTILGAKQTEWNLVHSILATTYMHAEGMFAKAKAKNAAGKDAGAEIEALAALVAQLGNEGDAAVAAVRKRLLEGGHHHNAAGEEKGAYDEGFVIVTRTARKTFLDAAKNIGRSAKDFAAVEAEWNKVRTEFEKVCEGGKG